ncbi:retinoblastoma-like protein 1 isoform X1 [Ambystoma mexicanum]|uniref:Retinoblastoma-like protein 1 n=4 Tax=Ambystoma TaxID=8295 RepID=A0A873AQI4_9SALA|nr:retinoblastoma-like protein 1 [Ambystoma andersoni]QOY46738.1 retinoblastoma-like protein 1 [Ambystoma velasci]
MADSQLPLGPAVGARAALAMLCQELNMDQETEAEALDTFNSTCSTFCLEGEVEHWLACALYVACRKSVIPTVGKGVMTGNCVSLTRILRSAKLSLIQFFVKMKKWMDMSNLPHEFRERIGNLERNFEVSTVIFKKFEPIFVDIFQNPYEDPPKMQRSRKHRRIPCSVKDLFNFCWTLFVYTKGNFRMIGDDLVNSYHLLLCCLDLIFANALQCTNRKDLLNPLFKALPDDYPDVERNFNEEPPCIIDTLCELHDGLIVEAKGIKEHYFKPYISKLFARKILKGDCLLDFANFAENNKALNKEYEEYVLTVGDFDERVFLGEDAEEEIGTPRKFAAEMFVGKITPSLNMECNLQQHFDKKRSFAPSTPLTGRRYLKEKEAMVTPVASATQSVSRLQSMVSGLKNAPSEQLLHIFRCCMRNPLEIITKRVKEIGDTFCKNYTQSTDDHSGSHIDFAVNRLKLAEVLYYKIMETIIVQETRRLHGRDMTALLEQDIFHRSLMACCLEIVLFAYSSQRTFPWIIEVLSLRPFYFYKVIEVLIRSEEGLSRDMVKHLNSIEEQILESRAWGHGSALWSVLQASENKVPTCEEVLFPSNFDTSNVGNILGHLPMMPLSPIVHRRLREVRTDLGGGVRGDFQPLSPISVHERYSSPTAGSAKRRLFGDDYSKDVGIEKMTMNETTNLKIIPSSISSEKRTVSPGQNILTMATATVTGSTGQKVTIPVHGVPNDTGGMTFIPISMNLLQSNADIGVQAPLTAQALISPSPKRCQISRAQEAHPAYGVKPKKTGSLALFFRKVYHLASVRLRDLCLKLDVSNDLLRKIWTCFEYTLVNCTDLMKDRHLDQLLLCSFYLMAKITKEEITFHDIMKYYRNQPQANSHVYRSVLLKHTGQVVTADSKNQSRNIEMDDVGDPSESKLPKSPCEATEEERGDLIKFYNTVYVRRVKCFAVKYAITSQDHLMAAPPLSPFPSIKQQPVSPRRISQQHSIYVSPHKNGSCLTPRTALLYKFNGSPSKSLKDINNMIKQGEPKTKKRAITIDSDTESPAKRLCQENDDVLLKRLQNVISERANH